MRKNMYMKHEMRICLWMRSIIMRYRVNNIVFNKQTTTSASAHDHQLGETQRFNSKTIIIVSLYERSLFGSVTVNFSLEFFILFDYFYLICCCCCSIFVSKIKLLLLSPFFMIINREKNKIMKKRTKKKKKKYWMKNTNIPYTWWFYVDQPNRTNINFENMIIIHGYCILCILYSNDCDLFESFF